MSWFTTYVEHPAVNALAALKANPVIAKNADATQAVAQVQSAATTIASTASTAAHQIAATAAAQADPVLGALGNGLTSVVDAYLMTLGPPGQLAEIPANAFIAMGEQFIHNYVASLFAHAKLQASAPAKPQ